jgi:hypothetical protein
VEQLHGQLSAPWSAFALDSANEILRMPIAFLRVVLLRHNIPQNLAGLFFREHFLRPLSSCTCALWKNRLVNVCNNSGYTLPVFYHVKNILS